MPAKFITYLSPAKLNLGLKVIGKREDGYHLLKTVFCLIDLFDEINIQLTDNAKISLIEHRQAWSYQKDLAYKAALLLQEYTKTNFGANIKIRKTIPSGSGMGGGSSNAATVLIALNQLWQTHITLSELINLGRSLGADIPFFIYGQNSIATGIGDEFMPLELPKLYFVLIQPEFHIATRDIFANFKFEEHLLTHEEITIEQLITNKENDLLATATKLFPRMADIIADLSQYAKPAMTGSGSVIYLTFSDFANAKKVASSLEKRYNSYLVKSLAHSPIYTTSF